MKSMTSRKPGFALATILILLSVALFSAGAVVTVSGLESKISVSEREGIDAYYVAEAGVDDALWKIQYNDPSCGNGGSAGCATLLQAGVLNHSYSSANSPSVGKSFNVSMVSTAGQPAGTVTVTVTGSVMTAGFTATRLIVSTAYLGPSVSAIGQTAFLSGGSVSIRNPNSTITIANGNFYGSGGIILNSATINLGSNCFQSQNNFASGTSTITSNGPSPCVQAANYPPLPPAISVPSVSFSYYASNNNASYNQASPTGSFDYAVQQGGSTVYFPGPVTYVNGNLGFGTSTNGKTINVTGMLVINGSLSSNGNMRNTQINIIDPGNGKSGIFVSQNINLNSGAFNDNGILYAASGISLLDTQPISVNGALITAGAVNINTGAALSLTFNNARATSAFGSGPPSVLQVRHWEEEY